MTEFSSRPIEPDQAPKFVAAAGYAGLVPFAAAALVSWLGLTLPFLGDPITMGQTYGAVVLSFLGGIRWGVALSPVSGATRDRDVLFSIFPPLAAWLALLLPQSVGIFILLVGFVAQLYWDMRAHGEGLIPKWFRDLRVVLTMGAVMCLVALLPQIA